MVISEYEKKSGLVAIEEKLLPKVKSYDEFLEYANKSENRADFVGVQYDDRVAFLEANDFEVTRENLINWELSHKEPVEPKKHRKFSLFRKK